MATYTNINYSLPSPKQGLSDIKTGWSDLISETQFPMDEDTIKAKLLNLLKIIGGAGQMTAPETDMVRAGVVGMGAGNAAREWTPSNIRSVNTVNEALMDRFKNPLVSWFKEAPIVLAEPQGNMRASVGTYDKYLKSVGHPLVGRFSDSVMNSPVVQRMKSQGYQGPIIGLSPDSLYSKNPLDLRLEILSGSKRPIPRDLERSMSVDQLTNLFPKELELTSNLIHEMGHPLYNDNFLLSRIATDALSDLNKNTGLVNMLSTSPYYSGISPNKFNSELFSRSIEPVAKKVMPWSPLFEENYHAGISPNFIELMDKFLQGSPKLRTPLDFGAAFTTDKSLENALKQLGGVYDPSWGNLLYRP